MCIIYIAFGQATLTIPGANISIPLSNSLGNLTAHNATNQSTNQAQNQQAQSQQNQQQNQTAANANAQNQQTQQSVNVFANKISLYSTKILNRIQIKYLSSFAVLTFNSNFVISKKDIETKSNVKIKLNNLN